MPNTHECRGHSCSKSRSKQSATSSRPAAAVKPATSLTAAAAAAAAAAAKQHRVHQHVHVHHKSNATLAQEDENRVLNATAMLGENLELYTDAVSCATEATYEGFSSGRLPVCTDFGGPLAGRWVADADPKRRVSFLACPLIASQYACSFLGLRHGYTAERMRWAPWSCQLRPFCAETLLSLLRGRRLIVIGDSHARQVYSSLACKLYASGAVVRITGPCNPTVIPRHVSASYPGANLSCLAGGQFTNGRILCGPRRCTGGPGAPFEALQGGPADGTDVHLRGGGQLLYREPVSPVAPPRADVGGNWGQTFYQRTFALLEKELRLTADDVLVVNDIGAARHAHEPHTLRALASSYAEASRHVPYHLLWVDAMAPHFSGAADGEFMHRGRHGELNREETRRSCGSPLRAAPKPFRADLDGGTACRPHKCDAHGASNLLTLSVLSSARLAVVHSFHATKSAHVAHHGLEFTNYSNWKIPDCHHVCQPSGPDELRNALIYNMLVSGWVFASTARREHTTNSTSPTGLPDYVATHDATPGHPLEAAAPASAAPTLGAKLGSTLRAALRATLSGALSAG